MPPVVDEVPTVPVEDIGSQMDDTERNASDDDGDNGRDTEVTEDEVLGGSLKFLHFQWKLKFVQFQWKTLADKWMQGS